MAGPSNPTNTTRPLAVSVHDFVAYGLRLPVLARLIPYNGKAWIFLFSSGMLGRVLSGAARSVADSPNINTREDNTNEQKVNTFVERIFMEGIGVGAGFAATHVSQDLIAKLLERHNASVHPAHLLNKLLRLPPQAGSQAPKEADLLALARSFIAVYMPEIKQAETFGINPKAFDSKVVYERLNTLSPTAVFQHLGSLKDIFNTNIYGDGKLTDLQKKFKALHGKSLEETFSASPNVLGELRHFLANNNKYSNFVVIGGSLVLSTLFSGIVWQKLNDGVIRQKLAPIVSQWLLPFFFPEEEEKNRTKEPYLAHQPKPLSQKEAALATTLEHPLPTAPLLAPAQKATAKPAPQETSFQASLFGDAWQESLPLLLPSEPPQQVAPRKGASPVAAPLWASPLFAKGGL